MQPTLQGNLEILEDFWYVAFEHSNTQNRKLHQFFSNLYCQFLRINLGSSTKNHYNYISHFPLPFFNNLHPPPFDCEVLSLPTLWDLRALEFQGSSHRWDSPWRPGHTWKTRPWPRASFPLEQSLSFRPNKKSKFRVGKNTDLWKIIGWMSSNHLFEIKAAKEKKYVKIHISPRLRWN